MRLAQSKKNTKSCFASLGLRVVRICRSKVNCARWSSDSLNLKVLERGKLVVESNPTILESHLNQDLGRPSLHCQHKSMHELLCKLYTYCTKFGVADQVTFEDCGI